jgi:hypothetical protein
MKVKCIINEPYYFFQLTKGQLYNVIEENIFSYKIIDDNGVTDKFEKGIFLSEKEIRKLKLKKLYNV